MAMKQPASFAEDLASRLELAMGIATRMHHGRAALFVSDEEAMMIITALRAYKRHPDLFIRLQDQMLYDYDHVKRLFEDE